MREALERGELSTRFQPIVVADTGRIVGAELLLRWHPPGGEISPAEFIAVAEKTGAIMPIGAWVFRQACHAEADWRGRWGDAAPYVAVNVSVQQLNDALLDEFEALARYRAFMDWSMALRDHTLAPNDPAFKQWQRRRISFRELAEDARFCYGYITAGMYVNFAQ